MRDDSTKEVAFVEWMSSIMFAAHKIVRSFFVLSYCSAIIFGNCRATSDSKPHVILILADDLGWNDVSFHGADEIPTPNIDALAYNGVILNRHYVQPICTPSRTALMTGRYPIREGLQGPVPKAGEPRGLRLNVTTMPEHLRRLGYETRLLGKWHLGYHTENHTPARRGFDTFFGYYNGAIAYFDKTHSARLDDGTVVTGYDLRRDGPEGSIVEFNNTEYFTDLITDEAERIIRNHDNEKPLFLEIAHLAVHGSASLTEILEVRNATENDETFSYIDNSDDRKFAGMVKALDDSVGRVLKSLADAKMLERSIVIFISDNGAPTISLTPGSNYPLRGVKNTLFEAGIRVPAVVFSPLMRNNSRLSEDLMHISDWLPTIYSAVGGDVSDLGEIDGVDQWDSLINGSASPRKDLLVNINEIKGAQAAIIGNYKLIEGAAAFGEGYYGRTGNDPTFPTYDLEKVLTSSAGRAIAQLSNVNGVSSSQARKLRELATVKCRRPTSWPNCSITCLFDIINDPCETRDLSNSHFEELQALRSYIREFREVLVPQQRAPFDPCSLPRYFNGTWSPWRRDDVNESTIVPGCSCGLDSTFV